MTVSLWRFNLSESFMPLQVVKVVLWQIPLGQWSLFLQVIASDNCFIKSVQSKEGAEGVGCGGPHQHKEVRNFAGMIGATKVGAVPVDELARFGCVKSDVTWFWTLLLLVHEKRACAM